ncbi:MAG: META domain-containing protein [Actinobacteria bacterium]|nr:META domain-containing protein [Actinomycetota bacterium]
MRRGSVLLVLVLAACLPQTGGEEATTTPTSLARTVLFDTDTHGVWQLLSGSQPDGEIRLVDTHPVTLEVTADGVGGRAGCNWYGWDGGDESSSTEMLCHPPDVMTLEESFLGALPRIDASRVEDDRLILTGPGVELVFERLDPVDLEAVLGVVWVMEAHYQGEVVTPNEGDPATLELSADGSFTGSTGCRTLTGRYVVSGAEIVFAEMAAHGECPASLQDQDGRVISGLEGGFRVVVEDGTLTTWTWGDEGLVYEASG